jgi:hypothetical protein
MEHNLTGGGIPAEPPFPYCARHKVVPFCGTENPTHPEPFIESTDGQCDATEKENVSFYNRIPDILDIDRTGLFSPTAGGKARPKLCNTRSRAYAQGRIIAKGFVYVREEIGRVCAVIIGKSDDVSARLPETQIPGV